MRSLDIRFAILGFVFAAVLGLAFVNAQPADAHPYQNYYPEGKWQVNPNVKAGDLQPWLDGSSSHRSKTQSDIDFARSQWNSVGAGLTFNSFNGFDSNIISLTACTTGHWGHVNIVTVSTSSLGGSLARTGTCGGQNSSTLVTRARMRISERTSPGSTWKKGGGSVSNTQWDLRSLITHELGHATGFGQHSKPDHFSATTWPCTNSTATRPTMCVGLPEGTVWKRDIEGHDTHTFELFYD